MKDIDNHVDVLTKYGWMFVRRNKHNIWRCPCGKHQLSISHTPSDKYAFNVFLRELRNTGCVSVKELTEEEIEIEVEGGVCAICKAKLNPSGFKKEWIEHNGMKVCVSHPGVKSWNRSFHGCNS